MGRSGRLRVCLGQFDQTRQAFFDQADDFLNQFFGIFAAQGRVGDVVGQARGEFAEQVNPSSRVGEFEGQGFLLAALHDQHQVGGGQQFGADRARAVVDDFRQAAPSL
jgi:hypothetical protein